MVKVREYCKKREKIQGRGGARWECNCAAHIEQHSGPAREKIKKLKTFPAARRTPSNEGAAMGVAWRCRGSD